MKVVGIVLLVLLGLLILALAAALVRTLLKEEKSASYRPQPDPAREELCAQKLARMVRCETETDLEGREPEKFVRFHRELERLFPRVHASLERTVIDNNLLYFWPGKEHDRPLVLMSHQDVVPAEGDWIYPPYSGNIADGKVWGRGAGDTKCSVMAFFQAVEDLLAEDYVPGQDVYLASSCTEEQAGDGAPKLVAELQRRGVKPFLVCDEGGGIITDPITGVPGSFAMVGVFEKGIANVKVTARSQGGHASAPPKKTPIARLAAFENRLEKRDPFRRHMSKEVVQMFENLGPYASFGLKYLFCNLWLFKPLLTLVMPAISPQAAAMLKTTVAFTRQSGSDANNVIPQEAWVVLNMRFIPHQGMEESLAILRKIAKKYDLEVEVLVGSDYTKPADITGEAWNTVMSAIDMSFPGLVASPYVVTGGTDARFYQKICDNCVRFSPVIYGPEQMKGMHGLNENIETNCLPGAVDYYKNLIRIHF